MSIVLSEQQRLAAIDAELAKRAADEERESLSSSLADFVREAWPHCRPQDPFLPNWHINVICEHLEAVSRGEIQFLQIWIPRVSMKSYLVSILWPAWEWTFSPGKRYWTASYELGLSGRLAGRCRDLMMTEWYQVRWGEVFTLMKEGERYYSNDKGGSRLATATGSTALGEHGHRIIIDDPINAGAADATSRSSLMGANDWYDSVIEGSKVDKTAAEIIVMQRLHENDVAGHALEMDRQAWTILCLPERYEAHHPYAWPRDPRQDGELLWPIKRGEAESNRMAQKLGSHRAAGQMQQRPAAREGEILKRHWWRFYDPKLFRDEKLKDRRPKFRSIVISVDTPLKDRESNDLIAVQAWGVVGADRYLIDLWKGHANFSQAKSQILRMSRDVRRMFPHTAHQILIENAGYGVELIQELKREVTGVIKISRGADGDKILRAESAASDLESGNCFLPGFRMGADEYSMPDERRCPADVVDFIDSCALFPNGKNDDDVDAWSQVMNWLRSRSVRPARTSSPFRRRR